MLTEQQRLRSQEHRGIAHPRDTDLMSHSPGWMHCAHVVSLLHQWQSGCGGKLTSISSATAEDLASNVTFPRLFLSSLLDLTVLILGFPQPWKT